MIKQARMLVVAVVAPMLIPAYTLAMSHGDHSGHDMDHSMHDEKKMDHGDHTMDHGDHDSMSMHGGMIMLGEQVENGVKADLHMKDVSEKMAEMGMDVTHHFMVSLSGADSGATLDKGIVAIKITDPAGNEGRAIKLTGMQGHFGADITLAQPGTYHFNVATRLDDGQTRKFHTSYTLE